MQIQELKSLQKDQPKVVSCRENSTVLRALTLMQQHGIRHLPVISDHHVVGMVSEHQIVTYAFQKGLLDSLDSVEVKHLMQKDIPAITVTTQVRDVIEMMIQGPFEALPVIQDGELTGIVTNTDILNLTARLTADGGQPAYGSLLLANPFAQRVLGLLADIGI